MPNVIRGYRRLSLAGQYMLATLLVTVVGTVALAGWLGDQIESSVLDRTAGVTALFVDSVIGPVLRPAATRGWLDPNQVAALDQILGNPGAREGIVAFKVWSPQGDVLYSLSPELVGRRFPIDPGLARALRGEVSAELTDLDEPENELERARWSRLLEVYVPVRAQETGEIGAAAEFYQLPDQLDTAITAARWRAWTIVVGAGAATYLLLAGIVKRGSDTIERQQEALRRQVAQLEELLRQNAGLRSRVQRSAERTTALNEQTLRRISADLHDGPSQALALALLRLDDLAASAPLADGARRDFVTIHGALRDALTEIRSISAGLRLPELAPLTPLEVAERAVDDHEHRSGLSVRFTGTAVPDRAPLAIKIALLRTLQESLSNATRHGRGADLAVELRGEDGGLVLVVTDAGPGFDPTAGAPGLGLSNMRERAQLLGGAFELRSVPGNGTVVRVSWPIGDPVAA